MPDILNTTPLNLFAMDQSMLLDYLAGEGEKPFRAEQLLKWLYHQRVTDFSEMTNISRLFREKLIAQTTTRLPKLASCSLSRDGCRKWLVEMVDGEKVEMVSIPDEGRNTLCISTQVGCALGCDVCATARLGFTRNLTADEIVGQVWLAAGELEKLKGEVPGITNVVMMGMGEPLLNFDSVITAINVFLDDLAFGLSKRKVTISTAGVVPSILKLKEVTDVSLAVSLHAVTNALRDKLIPLNRKYPLEQLIPACQSYVRDKNHRTITWEYVMLDGVNDSDQDARQLVRLIGKIPSKVNLIPFNPYPGSPYRCTPEDKMVRFSRLIHNSGITTTIRKSRGTDIDAACGQLVANSGKS
jgi:23S rRNA (adenine2503-C2)-methyltransferase